MRPTTHYKDVGPTREERIKMVLHKHKNVLGSAGKAYPISDLGLSRLWIADFGFWILDIYYSPALHD